MASNKNSSGKADSSIFKRTEFTLSVIIIILFILASSFTKSFGSMYNLTNLTKQGAIVGVMAVAQTIIIITGGIDISGGAIAGLGCMTMALLQTRTGTPFILTVLACLAVTTLCGLINGAIIFDLNVPAMIATLGTQTVIRGIVKLLCGALKAIYEKGLRIPEDISFISYGKPEFSPDMTMSEFFSLTSCKMGGSMI